MNFLTIKEIEKLKEKIPVGTKISLVKMNDKYTQIPKGTKGIVTGVDDIGTIHVNWEDGHGLGLAYGEDEYEIIE